MRKPLHCIGVHAWFVWLGILHLHDSMLLSVSVHWGKSSSVSVYPMRAYMPTGRGLTLEHAAGKHARQTKEHQSTWGHGQTSNRIPMLESRHIVTGFFQHSDRRGWKKGMDTNTRCCAVRPARRTECTSKWMTDCWFLGQSVAMSSDI